MRLIDADALYEEHTRLAYEGDYAFHITARSWLEKQPTVDAMPVVRCMDCKWWSEKLWACTDRGHGLASSDPDFYCADGERKGVDE